jgi:hypothetical protein
MRNEDEDAGEGRKELRVLKKRLSKHLRFYISRTRYEIEAR